MCKSFEVLFRFHLFSHFVFALGDLIDRCGFSPCWHAVSWFTNLPFLLGYSSFSVFRRHKYLSRTAGWRVTSLSTSSSFAPVFVLFLLWLFPTRGWCAAPAVPVFAHAVSFPLLCSAVPSTVSLCFEVCPNTVFSAKCWSALQMTWLCFALKWGVS